MLLQAVIPHKVRQVRCILKLAFPATIIEDSDNHLIMLRHVTF